MVNEIKAEFTGNLGSIAEVKTSASGKQYLTFNVGVTPAKKVGNEFVDGQTMWIRVTSFDVNQALADQLMKGAKVKVIGRLTQRTADNGKTYNDVIADEIEIVVREKRPQNNWAGAVPNAAPRSGNDWGAPVVTAWTDDSTPF